MGDLFNLDLNECSSLLLNGCTQKCNNNVGSYTCSCDPGYRLSKNRHTCDDIDECKKQDSCQHTCHNNVGSFTCSCRGGYELAADNISCIGKWYLKAKRFYQITLNKIINPQSNIVSFQTKRALIHFKSVRYTNVPKNPAKQITTTFNYLV